MNQNKKIIFAGTPEFAACSLRKLIEKNFSIELVLTQPDRPAGRGRALKPSEVKALALEHHLEIWQPNSLKTDEAYHKIKSVGCDFMVVVAYGLIIPKVILDIPKLACVNVHASLLPRWRGAAPIQRCIEAGDPYSGVCIMKMDEGLDTGPVISKATCPVSDDATSGQLHDQLAHFGADTLVDVLANWDKKRPIMQNHKEATYAHKIKKQDAQIQWSDSAAQISRKVRAFNPWPVCYTTIQNTAKKLSAKKKSDDVLRIWQVTVFESGEPSVSFNHDMIDPGDVSTPGTVLEVSKQGVKVLTGQGTLMITQVQKTGAKPMTVSEVINGHPELFNVGQILGSASS